MFGRVSKLNRLDCVRESLRLALREVALGVAEAARPAWWNVLWERYVESQADYRASSETLSRKLAEAGTDAQRLLAWLREPPEGLAQGEQARLLARVFGEPFEVKAGSAAPPPKSQEPVATLAEAVLASPSAAAPAQNQEGLSAGAASPMAEPDCPPSPEEKPGPQAPGSGTVVEPKGKGQLASDRVQNPHDPEATYAVKGQGQQKKEHVGYKIQVAETVSEAVLAPGERQMKQAQAAPQRDGRFTVADFQIQVEERRAVCPAGKLSTQCSRLENAVTGKVDYRFEFSTQCHDCPRRPQCLGKDQPHRTVVVGEHHSALQARRQEQQTDAFKARMKHRNAIEGTQSELVRAHGLRQAKYRGLAKVKRQNYFIGAACNVKRWLRREAWKIQQAMKAVAAEATGQTAN
jgi:hypothetical protein